MKTKQKVQPWNREHFLKVRAEGIAAVKHLHSTVDKNGFTHLVMDPGDKIICDYCNALIENEFFITIEYGKKALCSNCSSEVDNEG